MSVCIVYSPEDGQQTSLSESACEFNFFQINVSKMWGEEGFNFLDKLCQHLDNHVSEIHILKTNKVNLIPEGKRSNSIQSMRKEAFGRKLLQGWFDTENAFLQILSM